MKTIIKNPLFYTSLTVLLSIIFNCQNPNTQLDQGNSWIEVVTPDYSPLNKAVFNLTTEEAKNLQGSIRYDIIIESNGKIIKKTTLKKNQKSQIEVPSGKKFNVGVGIYLAKSKSDEDVLINSYFVSDTVNNVMVTSGDTVYIVLTLDYNKPSAWTYYYTNENGQYLGMADITGSVIADFSAASALYNPMFVSADLYTGVPNASYFYTGNGSEHFYISDRTLLNHRGKMFAVLNSSTTNYYWFIDNIDKRIRYNNTPVISIDNVISNFNSQNLIINYDPATNASAFLPNVERLVSVFKNATRPDLLYYFLIHKNGMLVTCYFGNGFTDLFNIDFSGYSSIHPNLPFILEIKRDDDINNDNYFFLSKIGAFLVDNITLNNFASNDTASAMSRLKRKIVIPDNYDTRLNQVINDVEILGNNIYLSTAQGIYKINKSSSAWTNFKNSSPTESKIFPEDKIEKVKSFSGKKIMSLFSDNNNVLFIATNSSVCFYNTDTKDFKEYTVWDGIPFIPKNKPAYEADFSETDYQRGGMSPVRNILWDSQYNKYWIATMHGLVSIDKSEVF